MRYVTDEQDLGVISVLQLAEALNGGEDQERTIRLPAFQRDAVWDEERIVLLWDSLIRDYPIGSLLFAPATGAVKRVAPVGVAGETKRVGGTEFIIIDGQQRSNAIALGVRHWQPGDSMRLWLDAAALDEGTAPADALYVCSWRHPWGHRGATLNRQRQALQALDRWQLEIGEKVLAETWPVAAKLPVPLAAVIEWLRHEKQESWDELLERTAEHRNAANPPEPESFLEGLRQALVNHIPVYFVNRKRVDHLHVIFERLNRQGVRMSNQDLFFSALKVEWPQAHDLVWEIYGDPETGRFLQQTEIVHLAVRLAEREGGGDILSLTPESFKRFARGDSEEQGSPEMQRVQALLRRPDTEDAGWLHRALREARRALEYQPENGVEDPGFPAPLLAQLPAHVWHAVVAWIVAHGLVDAESRLEMLRYACLDLFHADSSSTVMMRVPFALAYDIADTFPGREIYRELQQRSEQRSSPLLVPISILTPAAYRARLVHEDGRPAGSVLQHERALIMWNERYWFSQWFPNYDPTLYTSAATRPYDADHIVPRKYFDLRRGRNAADPVPPFKSWRSALRDSAGNLRYLPREINRSDGSVKVQDKHLIGPTGQPVEKRFYNHFNLKTVGDVRAASLLGEDKDVHKDWLTASTGGKRWHGENGQRRLEALKRVVVARRAALYENLYAALGWEAWAEREEGIA